MELLSQSDETLSHSHVLRKALESGHQMKSNLGGMLLLLLLLALCGNALSLRRLPLKASFVDVQASTIRKLSLYDYKGKRTTVASKIGGGKSIVVFLRHLG